MTPAELGQTVKQKYPGVYDQFPDEVVGYRTIAKYPDYENQVGAMGHIGQAAEDLFTKPASAIGDLATNPETMANAMPPVLGAAGGMLPIPGGATMGTAAGQGIRDVALKTLGKPVPSPLQHGLELGGAALGDLTAIPAINRARIGNEIGGAESAVGVPPPQDIPSLPKPTAGQPVSGGIDETINAVKRASGQGAGSPTFWKQIKDQIDAFYNAGRDAKLSNLDNAKLAWLNGQVQKGLNAAVPGRGPLAADLARSQIVPNAIESGWQAIPKSVKYGLGFGTAGGASVAGVDLLKKALSGQ